MLSASRGRQRTILSRRTPYCLRILRPQIQKARRRMGCLRRRTDPRLTVCTRWLGFLRGMFPERREKSRCMMERSYKEFNHSRNANFSRNSSTHTPFSDFLANSSICVLLMNEQYHYRPLLQRAILLPNTLRMTLELPPFHTASIPRMRLRFASVELDQRSKPDLLNAIKTASVIMRRKIVHNTLCGSCITVEKPKEAFYASMIPQKKHLRLGYLHRVVVHKEQVTSPNINKVKRITDSS